MNDKISIDQNVLFFLKIFLGLNQVQDVLFEADISAMYADADAVVQIVKALTMRAAALISTALAGVIKAIANEKHSYAISGIIIFMKGWTCK